jgi:hypothetical protein
MTAKEEKKEDDNNNNTLLNREIESWNKHFGYALREENRILFNQMLSDCLTDEEQYRNAVNSKVENYSTESLFMALIFQQQKTISQLIVKLSS